VVRGGERARIELKWNFFIIFTKRAFSLNCRGTDPGATCGGGKKHKFLQIEKNQVRSCGRGRLGCDRSYLGTEEEGEIATTTKEGGGVPGPKALGTHTRLGS